MKKNEFFEQAKKDLNMSDKQYHEVVNRIFNSISEALIKGENVKIRGFGTFKITNYKERNGRNPKLEKTFVFLLKEWLNWMLLKTWKTKFKNLNHKKMLS